MKRREDSFFCENELKWPKESNAATKNEYTGLDIPHLETGRDFPSLTTIAILCKFYNITIVEFFSPIDYPAKE